MKQKTNTERERERERRGGEWHESNRKVCTSETYSMLSMYSSRAASQIPSCTDRERALLNVYFSRSVGPSGFKKIVSRTSFVRDL